MTVNTRHKKLIEVALPLDAINKASVREKSIRYGHPCTLHLWWARRPLATARAVIFAQMVDDPSAHPNRYPTEEEQTKERLRLFGIIEELVKWENLNNKNVLKEAREAIRESWRNTCEDNKNHPDADFLFDIARLPAFHDPFAGGGALPLEAQRLGLDAYASDLNPVAVLINKAMIEFPPKFAGHPPVSPDPQRMFDRARTRQSWRGVSGLAEDVRFYGQWMHDQARKRIGHLYQKIEITAKMTQDRSDLKNYVGRSLTVIAWLWARTVRSPNPAFSQVHVPLVSSFLLSKKKGKKVWVEPVIENGEYRFIVKVGSPSNIAAMKAGTKLSRGANFWCVMSGAPINSEYIRSEFKSKRASAKLMAIVVKGDRQRIFLSPTNEHELTACLEQPTWRPEIDMNQDCKDLLSGRGYGFRQWHEIFATRQLIALTTFFDLVCEARRLVRQDAIAANLPDDQVSVQDGGVGATAYADTVAVYLSFVVDKCADFWSTICTWNLSIETVRCTFGRQAIPMTWDYAEANPFSSSTGSWNVMLERVWKSISKLPIGKSGYANQENAQTQKMSYKRIVSTDPPYYDNIGYADLSDFFYIWLRRSLRQIFPDLFVTVTVPKAKELVATPYRHGGKKAAERFFLEGMTCAISRLAEQTHPSFPVTIYYAFKQQERKGGYGVSNTGWETFLEAVIRSGFAVTGTWPVRTERRGRMIAIGANALASSIVLVCRKRPPDAPIVTRREFVPALQSEISEALSHLREGGIAPVDLAQAAIGPGMAVYTRYASVVDAADNPLTVNEVLTLINQKLDEILTEQEGELDSDTQWALAWFELHGFTEDDYGGAETLSRAKNTSVNGLVQAGILEATGGKVRLLKPQELPDNWDPRTDPRRSIWNAVHQLVRILESGGEQATAELTFKLGSEAEIARDLAYRLYSICERNNRVRLGLRYNSLIQSWPEVARLVAGQQSNQQTVFDLS